jgi:aspartate aminotransferase
MLYETFEKIYALEKQGKEIIKLNVGEPDWRPPANVIQTACDALKKGKDKYSSSAGLLELREKIAELHGCNTKNVVITTGSKWGIYALLSLHIRAGDNVIIFSPHWTAYDLICKQLGASTKIVNLKMENNFAIDSGKLESAINNTKFIILNSPCNPTSKAWSESEEEEIINIARKKGIIVLADDAYRDLCFDARKERKFEDNLFIANTFSKTFGMTGWRVGYVVVTDEIAKRLTSFNNITTTNVPVFLQLAALKALEQKTKIALKARETCKKRVELAASVLGKKLTFSKPDAGFYIFPKLPNGTDTINFVNKLLDNGVAVVPGAAFGNYEQHIRISLAADEKKLKLALEKITELI